MDGRSADHQHLPQQHHFQPAPDRWANARHIVRLQWRAQKDVVQPVLDRQREEKGEYPEAEINAIAQAEYVRRQRVQTRARNERPATVTRPICRLGSNLRLTRFLA